MKSKKTVSKDNLQKEHAKADSDSEKKEVVDGMPEIPCDDTEKDTIISEQKAKIEELNDKYLRLYAEFDNYRKRTIKERIELSKTAASNVIASLLPVLDDYERAINAIPDNDSTKAIKDGIILIYNKYKAVLAKNGLEEIKSLGEVFNTDLHEAIAHVPAETDDQKGKIVDLVEKGYYINGVLLRFAKVVVAN